MAANKPKFRGYSQGHIGASKTRSYEDRHCFDSFTTQGGLEVTVAMVADGVGGGNLGQRAAELTIDTVKNQIKASTHSETEILQMLGAAIGMANKAVYQEAKSDPSKSGMSSTLSIALLHDEKLYVANVGDSRIYLIRDGKVKQVTVDHTFANERIRQGLLTAEKAHQHPNANAITRSIGFEPKVVIDFGLYIEGGQENGQKAYAKQGLPLGKDDVLLVCSDGLIKESHREKNRHYVEDAEIIETAKQYHAEEAAKVLVDLAVGRDVDDNVTAIVVEVEGRKIRNTRRQRAVIWSSISLALLIILFGVIRQLMGVTGQLGQLAQANINGTHTAAAKTAIAASFTQTPSSTPRPTLIPGEIGAIFINGNRQPFVVNDPILAPDFAEVRVNHTGEDEDGQIYLLAQSKILFEAVPSDVMDFVVFPKSQLFVYPGRYTAGAGMRIAEAKGTVDFLVSGSCLALDYEAGRVVASCYEGHCSLQINYGDKVSIPAGMELELDTNTLSIGAPQDIPLSNVYAWLEMLPKDTHARQCVNALVPAAAPTEKSGNDRDDPKTKPTVVRPTDPPTQPPSDPPTQPPSDPPTQPPSDPPTQPPSDPPTQPPSDPPTQPPSDPPHPPDNPPDPPHPPDNPPDPPGNPHDPTGEPTN